MSQEYKRAMIFGVFDNLHEGHKFFINEAQKVSLELVVVLAPTQAVFKMKGKFPFYSIKERMDAIAHIFPNVILVEGDQDENLWSPIAQYQPDTIICGYDQEKLYDALKKIQEKFGFKLTKLDENFGGTEMHSRFLNKSV